MASHARMRIILVGNGGREHTLAWKLAQSERVDCIHIVPGNGGTAGVPKCQNITSVSSDDFPALVKHAQLNNLNFLIPGPEAPLVAGIVDYFNTHAPEIQCFGPTASAARMEGSKTFAKDFMKRHGIPTARYENFDSYDEALKFLESVKYDVVIKADGLAAGKGVIIPSSKAEAEGALKEIMLDREFGDAGRQVVVEEFLRGEEISILSLSDGQTLLSLPLAQDHKRIGDNDTGPNTGGMGTYAPTPLATQDLLDQIERTVLQPTIQGMKEEGMPFTGCLFTGLMLTKSGPRVLEYNVRFGDPESQSCLPLLQSDLAELMQACCTGTLSSHTISISEQSACTVVMAAKGYPGAYEKGTPIYINDTPKPKTDKEAEEGSTYLFHAGTSFNNEGQLVTSGGRVIAATATGGTLREAVRRAYERVGKVRFEGMQFRRDIGARALR